MRILILSNLYPPYCIGGYEMRCEDVVNGLVARGHEVRILTSMWGVGRAVRGPVVWRTLPARWKPFNPAPPLARLLWWELSGIHRLRRQLRLFHPDVVSMWNMHGLSPALTTTVMRSGCGLVLDIDDDWPLKESPWRVAWAGKKRASRLLLDCALRPCVRHWNPLSALPRQATRFVFISGFRKRQHVDAGMPVQDAAVIHGGIECAFLGRKYEQISACAPPRRFLFCGVLTPEKAPHTAIEAVGLLRGLGLMDVALTVAGFPGPSDYVLAMKRRVKEMGLDDVVRFEAGRPRQAMPAVYQAHDVLLFTSVSAEGFPLVILEAMAGGLAVVSSVTGGNADILHNGENCLTFPAGDATVLAARMHALMTDPAMAIRLARAGHEVVQRVYTKDKMVAQHECLFEEVLAERRHQARREQGRRTAW